MGQSRQGRPPRLKLTPPDPHEDQLQTSIADLFEAVLPRDEVAWTHIAHGGYQLSPAARARLFRLGLKRGFSDFVLAYEPGRVLWLEVKTRTGRLSGDQEFNHVLLKSLGHKVEVCRSIDEVMRALVRHGVPHRTVTTLETTYGTTAQAVSGATQSQPAQLPERASSAA